MTEVWYATLAQAREEVREHDPAIKTGDPYIRRALDHISARIDTRKSLTYAPLDDTRYYDSLGDHIYDPRNELYLDYPLMEVTRIVVGGVTWTADIDYVTEPRGRTPISSIRIPASSGKRWSQSSGDWADNIAITGPWGYRRDYARAFIDSADTVRDAPLLPGATTITVSAYTDASGDVFGRKPRWSAGQLLRLVSASGTEYVFVADTVSPTLTVVRSVRGTLPLQHAQGTKIEIWQPELPVERACLRWASYLYARRARFESVTFDGVKATQFPADIPEEVENILNEMPNFFGWEVA